MLHLQNNQTENLKKIYKSIDKKNLQISNPFIVCLSNDAIYISNQINKYLKSNIDIGYLFSEIITAPKNQECSIGVSNITSNIKANESLIKFFGIKENYVDEQIKINSKSLEDRLKMMNKTFNKKDFKDKDIFLIDIALSTGESMALSAKTAKILGAKQVFGIVFLSSSDALNMVKKSLDHIFYCTKIKHFIDKEFTNRSKNE